MLKLANKQYNNHSHSMKWVQKLFTLENFFSVKKKGEEQRGGKGGEGSDLQSYNRIIKK